MKTVIGRRRRAFEWICRKAGIQVGQRLPWWAMVLLLALFPSCIRLAMASSVYDVMTDTIKAGSARWCLSVLERMSRPSPPGHWFRVVGKSPDGVVQLEWRDDNGKQDGGGYGPPPLDGSPEAEERYAAWAATHGCQPGCAPLLVSKLHALGYRIVKATNKTTEV